jgi:hypothetical protein
MIGLTRLARPLSDCQKPRRNGKYNTLHADLSAISILKYQKYIPFIEPPEITGGA